MISSLPKRLFLATALAGLALTGCSPVGDDLTSEDDQVETTPQEDADAEGDESEGADGEDAGDESAPPEGESAGDSEPDAAAAPEGPECLIGDWRISEEEMQSFYDSMDTPAEFAISGDTGLRFAEDTYEYTPNFTLEMNVAGQDASGTMTGSITGSYTTDAGVVTTSNEDNDISLQLSVGGVEVDGTETGEGYLDASPVNSAPYECTSGGPVITFQNTGDGVDIQLTPND